MTELEAGDGDDDGDDGRGGSDGAERAVRMTERRLESSLGPGEGRLQGYDHGVACTLFTGIHFHWRCSMFTPNELLEIEAWKEALDQGELANNKIKATILSTVFGPDRILVILQSENGESPSAIMAGTDNLWEWTIDQQPNALAFDANEMEGAAFFAGAQTENGVEAFLFVRKPVG